MRLSSLAAATTLGFVLALGSAIAPASAGPADQLANCAALGGTVTGNGANQVCTVTVVVVSPDVASGGPSVDYGPDRPVGAAVTVDTSTPVRQPDPAVSAEEGDVGEPVVVRSERAGTPTITEVERDRGAATDEHVVEPGTPTSTHRTELGIATSVDAATAIDCRRVNAARAARSVEKCERAILTTTTTPTTIVTTTTTPQELVTTSTQPRETLITTTTPYTEVFTSTQQRELCTTTTYSTLIATLTTQATERTETTTQPTTRTTTTTVTSYNYPRGTDLPTLFSSSSSSTSATGSPVVTTAAVPGTPILTDGQRAGDDESDVVCEPIAADVTSVDGATWDVATTATAPAEPIVTVTRAEIDPLVVDSASAGADIVSTSIRGLAEMCVVNPSQSAQRGNAC